MDLAFMNFDSNDEEMIDKFYTSKFTITFEDKTRDDTAKVKFDMSPEVWELFEQLVKTVKDNVEDYE
jgi:hypothetical protein